MKNKGRHIIILCIVVSFLILLYRDVKLLEDKEKEIVQLSESLEESKLEIKDLKEKVKNNENLLKDINDFSLILENKDKLIRDYEKRVLELERELGNQSKKDDMKQENIEEVVNRGSKRNIKEVTFEVTMYTNAEGAYKKGSKNYGTMASGEKTFIGAIAAPKSIPFDTRIVFRDLPEGWESLGKGAFVVKDRGGAIKEKVVNGEKVYCIDIYIGDKEVAKKWGRRLVKGFILSEVI